MNKEYIIDIINKFKQECSSFEISFPEIDYKVRTLNVIKEVNSLSENFEVASRIDHTILKQDASKEEVVKLCEEAIKYNFASVCVNPYYIPLCSHKLKDSQSEVCTVIGFPLGANTAKTKFFEAEESIDSGATELDMVINIGALKNKQYEYVFEEIKGLAEIAHDNGIILKVIIETCLLTEDEKVKACLLSIAAGADYVKTSTGFSKSGATIEDIAIMRFVVGDNVGVKASGGVRTRNDAELMILNGATRIGASASISILEGK